jgi:hypothetical protein
MTAPALAVVPIMAVPFVPFVPSVPSVPSAAMLIPVIVIVVIVRGRIVVRRINWGIIGRIIRWVVGRIIRWIVGWVVGRGAGSGGRSHDRRVTTRHGRRIARSHPNWRDCRRVTADGRGRNSTSATTPCCRSRGSASAATSRYRSTANISATSNRTIRIGGSSRRRWSIWRIDPILSGTLATAGIVPALVGLGA